MTVIGISADFELPTHGRRRHPRYWVKQAYVEAVREAGGLPVIFPHLGGPEEVEAAMALIDGLLITGGAFDIPPELYGETPREGMGPVNAARTSFEVEALRLAAAREMPVLGVCGGMQLMNVVAGGTLYQDLGRELPGALEHEQTSDPVGADHPVTIVEGSLLAAAFPGAETLQVNTTHHQAVRELGAGLRVSALAPDGVIEAVEGEGAGYYLGVQWHPELLEDKRQLSLYRAFLSAARAFRS